MSLHPEGLRSMWGLSKSARRVTSYSPSCSFSFWLLIFIFHSSDGFIHQSPDNINIISSLVALFSLITNIIFMLGIAQWLVKESGCIHDWGSPIYFQLKKVDYGLEFKSLRDFVRQWIGARSASSSIIVLVHPVCPWQLSMTLNSLHIHLWDTLSCTRVICLDCTRRSRQARTTTPRQSGTPSHQR